MFLEERQNAIADLIAERGRVTVSDLASRFDVSDDCIRKDLKQLVEEGRAKKVYGGAIRPEAGPERVALNRVDTNVEEKRAIAERAYGLIEPGDTVFLDMSSTNHYLAQLLASGDIRCQVVSNMIDILQILATNQLVTAIGTGGTVNREFNGFVGARTVEALRPLRFDRAFIAALGVDAATGDVLTFDADDGIVKRCALERSREAYLVADAEKFGAWGTYSFGNVRDFTAVVTAPVTPELVASLEEAGAAVL
ncbi:DeoR/GlpR family DNA-binding transcription regulator [Atopobiaceae bacterium 24-176]